MLSQITNSTLRQSTPLCRSYFGSHAHKVTTVLETKNNPQKQKQLRGQQQMHLHMTEYAKDFYYIHNKQRKLFSLYNVFSSLPSAITNQFANLVQEPKVTLASDQIFLPKISENSVPVYESVGNFAATLRTVNKIAVGLPVFALTTAVMPWLTAVSLGLHYFIYFKSSYGKATDRFVVKLELLPETEEFIYQKVTRTGSLSTSRVSLSDVEAVDPEVDSTKYSRDLVFERSMSSALDMNMIFRVKSTGQILMFDREGVWHEEGLNHELMP